MARSSFEDSLDGDVRFQALVKLLDGDAEKAYGRLLRLWRLGKKYWADGKKLIPEKVFDMGGFEHILDTDFAERRDDGIYVRGASDRWQWLLDLKAAASAGGKKSAEARKVKYGTAIPPNATNRSKTEPCAEANPNGSPKQIRTGAEPQTEAKPNALSIVSSNSISNSLSLTPNGVITRAREDRGDLTIRATKMVSEIKKACLENHKKHDSDVLYQGAILAAVGQEVVDLVRSYYGSWMEMLKQFSSALKHGKEEIFTGQLRNALVAEMSSRGKGA